MINTIINKLGLDNKKITLIVIFCVIIFYADYNFILGLQSSSANSARTKIKKLEKDIADLDKNVKRMNQLKASADKSNNLKQIVTEEGLPKLLEEISNIANNNKVRILQIKPVREVKQKDQKAASGGKTEEPLQILLEVTGSYHNLGKFINQLENMNILTILNEIRMRRDADDFLKIDCNISYLTYIKK